MALVTLADTKSWLGITGTDEDTTLTALIAAASVAVSNYCNRELESATVTEDYEGTGSRMIFARRWPITSITSVTLPDLSRTATVRYSGRAVIRTDGEKFPYKEWVQMTYTGGYTTAPADLQQAVLMTVAAMRNAQAFDPNLTSENLGGVFGGGFDMQGAGGVPRSARGILENYASRFDAP